MKRILIVDDEPDITEAFLQGASYDYEVSIANSGPDALKLIQETKPEFIVLDWRLNSDPDGKDVLIYTKKEYPTIPVWVVTAFSHIKKESKALGADECITKPCHDLITRIKKVLPP